LPQIRVGRAGEVGVDINMNIDLNGLLNVTVRDQFTKKEKSLVIQNAKTISDEEVMQIKQQREAAIEEEKEIKVKETLKLAKVNYTE
jgi:molecular chaperone DnaK (HSP70)